MALINLGKFPQGNALNSMAALVSKKLSGTHMASPASPGCWVYETWHVDQKLDTMEVLMGFDLKYMGPKTGGEWWPLMSDVKITTHALEDLHQLGMADRALARMVFNGTAKDIAQMEEGLWDPWNECPELLEPHPQYGVSPALGLMAGVGGAAGTGGDVKLMGGVGGASGVSPGPASWNW